MATDTFPTELWRISVDRIRTPYNIAGQVATQAIVSATSVSASVKSKDEITFDVKTQQPGGASPVAQQFKATEKSKGDNIISQVVEEVNSLRP